MNFKKIILLSAILAISLGACRKRQKMVAYLVKVSADDANTSIVWKEDFDLSSSNIKQSKIIDSLADKYSYNVNDAIVSSVIINKLVIVVSILPIIIQVNFNEFI